MAPQQQLSFLQEKIRQIGSAIFFNESDSVLKLPTSLVSTLKVDDYGYVWFMIQKPRQDLKEFEQDFPVRLDFFKKGTHGFLQVRGKGWVVNDPEEMNALEGLPMNARQLALQHMVLVKVKMSRADYFEPRPAKTSWWKQAAGNVTAWFRHSNNTYRPDIYYPAS